jgi:putative salt-induced outer membrane protein
MQRIAARYLISPLLLLAPFLAHAQAGAPAEPPPAPTPFWGDAAVGYLSTAGNSSTSSVNAKFSLDYQQQPLHNAFVAQAQTARADGESTAESYLVTDKLDYTFYQNTYGFLAADYQKDLFGGIRKRTSETVGIGQHFLTGPAHYLDAEIGAGARQQQLQDSREKDNDLIGRFGTDYRYRIDDKNGFRQQVKVEYGEANTFTQSISELKLYVIGNVFAALSYTVQHNSAVDDGVKHTDTTTAVNVSYAFGRKPG